MFRRVAIVVAVGAGLVGIGGGIAMADDPTLSPEQQRRNQCILELMSVNGHYELLTSPDCKVILGPQRQ